ASPVSSSTYTLNVTDSKGCIASDTVSINLSPYPQVNAGNDEIACNQAIPLTLIGYSPSGGTWSGNGVTPAGIFTPSSVGVMTLTYTVTNGTGCTSSDQVDINVGNAPVIDAGIDKTVCANEAPLSLATGSPGQWSGVGVIDAGAGMFDPQNAGSGIHIISLSTGSGTCYVTDQVSINVLALPLVEAGSNQSLCGNEGIVTLSGNSPQGGSWDGPGIVDDSAGTFNTAIGQGSYSMFYHYEDGITGCADTANKVIVIHPFPSAAFTISSPVCINSSIIPVNSSSDATLYEWEFGDNTPAVEGQAPEHIFDFTGNYTASLTASNSFGCISQLTKNVEVISAPVAGLQLSATSGCEPFVVQLSNTSQGSYAQYNWDLANSSFSGFEPIDQTYSVLNGVSSYEIELTASNICGSSIASQTLNVLPKPLALFNTDIVSTICSPVTVSFQNQSTGYPFSCHWNLGDGEDVSLVNPEDNVYTTGTQPSQYTIWLHVENICGVDSISQTIVVQPNNVTAAFAPSVLQGCAPLNVNMLNSSDGATDYYYSVPALSIESFVEAPSFTFSPPGTYNVILHATDGCGSSTANVQVEVLESPTADFVTDLPYSCENGEVQFTATSNIGNQFAWDFGDQMSGEGQTVSYNYSTYGIFDVGLVVTAPNMCSTGISYPFEVKQNPVADFTLPQTAGCSPFQFCPVNNSAGADNYLWNYGDGQILSGDAPCHSYNNNSSIQITRTIVLEAMNEFMCTDTDTLEVVIQPLPMTNFTMDIYSSCSTPIEVYPSLGGQGVSSQSWTIDGVEVSAELSPELVIAGIGEHIVGVTSINEFGCTRSESQNFDIYEPPLASLSAFPMNGCLDLDVNFTNETAGSNSYQWVFGDGAGSTETSPQHTYTQQGVFSVQLIATSAEGCTDTLTMENMIETYDLPVASFEMSTEETTIYLPEITFTNTSFDGAEYEWTFGDGNGSTLENPVYSYSYPGLWPVTLTVSNAYGCVDKIERNVKITNDYMVFIPNAFTPDNDGINDAFRPEIENIEFISNYTFQIFDRWGTTIFETHHPEEAWTGDVKGGEYFAENSSYSYRIVLSTTFDTNVKEITGHVTLLR
ncbi:MAG: PKD domain-containing protein, partial [Crocinitomicaceae bacterium]|nr:PKD domain-containing protein [Crocinitomicaceae bacterium]